MTARSRHRVVRVREWDHQTTGASCCGRLDGRVVSCGPIPLPAVALRLIRDVLPAA